MHPHVVILGAGIMGSAAARAAVGRGWRVTVFDRFGPFHRRGSSHGQTRGIRLAYEDPEYAAWAREAFGAWRALEGESGRSLLTMVGGLDAGDASSPSLARTLSTLRDLALEHRIVDGAAVAHEWPGMTLPRGWIGVVQPDAGLIAADDAWRVMVTLAERGGASFRWETEVVGVEGGTRSGGARVALATGERVAADAIIVTAGPWTDAFVPRPITVLRCEPLTASLDRAPEAMPLYFIHPDSDGERAGAGDAWAEGVYVQPQSAADGRARIKVGRHGGSADGLVGEGPVEAVEPLLRRASRVVPALADVPVTRVTRETCFYSMTTDERFVIEPANDVGHRVVVGAGFSGHGFKFAPLVGERLAALAARALEA